MVNDKGKIKEVVAFFMVFLMIFTFPVSDAEAAPESYQFENYVKADTVNEFTGDMGLALPLFTVPGRGGMDYSISLSYQSGIKPEQQASVVGLGWNLDLPVVGRQVNGFPDDWSDMGACNADGGIDGCNSFMKNNFLPEYPNFVFYKEMENMKSAEKKAKNNMIKSAIVGIALAAVTAGISTGISASGVASAAVAEGASQSVASEFVQNQVSNAMTSSIQHNSISAALSTSYGVYELGRDSAKSTAELSAQQKFTKDMMDLSSVSQGKLKQIGKIHSDQNSGDSNPDDFYAVTDVNSDIYVVSSPAYAGELILEGDDNPHFYPSFYSSTGNPNTLDNVEDTPLIADFGSAHSLGGMSLNLDGVKATETENTFVPLVSTEEITGTEHPIEGFMVIDSSGNRYIYTEEVEEYVVGDGLNDGFIPLDIIDEIDPTRVMTFSTFSWTDLYPGGILYNTPSNLHEDENGRLGSLSLFKNGYVSSWGITRILGGNKALSGHGGEIEFSYIDVDGPQGDGVFTESNSGVTHIGTTFGIDDDYFVSQSGHKTMSRSYKKYKLIDMISTDTHHVKFFYEYDRNDGKEVYAASTSELDGFPSLSKVILYSDYDGNSVPLEKYEFGYDYSLVRGAPDNVLSLTDPNSGRLTLRNVTYFVCDDSNDDGDCDDSGEWNPLPSFIFEYAEGDAPNLVGNVCSGYDTDDVVECLYENPGNDVNMNIIQDTKNPIYVKNAVDRWGYFYLNNFRDNIHNPNMNENGMADVWSLTKVYWPNGGSTEWDYEEDSFEYYNDVPVDELTGGDRQILNGGGLRVKKVTHCDGMGGVGECYSSNYKYVQDPVVQSFFDSSGVSTGIPRSPMYDAQYRKRLSLEDGNIIQESSLAAHIDQTQGSNYGVGYSRVHIYSGDSGMIQDSKSGLISKDYSTTKYYPISGDGDYVSDMVYPFYGWGYSESMDSDSNVVYGGDYIGLSDTMFLPMVEEDYNNHLIFDESEPYYVTSSRPGYLFLVYVDSLVDCDGGDSWAYQYHCDNGHRYYHEYPQIKSKIQHPHYRLGSDGYNYDPVGEGPYEAPFVGEPCGEDSNGEINQWCGSVRFNYNGWPDAIIEDYYDEEFDTSWLHDAGDDAGALLVFCPSTEGGIIDLGGNYENNPLEDGIYWAEEIESGFSIVDTYTGYDNFPWSDVPFIEGDVCQFVYGGGTWGNEVDDNAPLWNGNDNFYSNHGMSHWGSAENVLFADSYLESAGGCIDTGDDGICDISQFSGNIVAKNIKNYGLGINVMTNHYSIDEYPDFLHPNAVYQNQYYFNDGLYMDSRDSYIGSVSTFRKASVVDGKGSHVDFSEFDEVTGAPMKTVAFGNGGKKNIVEVEFAYNAENQNDLNNAFGLRNLHMLNVPYTETVKDQSNENNPDSFVSRKMYSYSDSWCGDDNEFFSSSVCDRTANGAWLVDSTTASKITDGGGIISVDISKNLAHDRNLNLLVSEDPKERKVYFSYGDNGVHCGETHSPYGNDGSLFVTDSYYDGSLLTCVENELGHQVKSTFDDVGRILSIEDANEVSVDYTYDDYSRLDTVSAPGITEGQRIPLVFYDYNYGMLNCEELASLEEDGNDECRNYVEVRGVIDSGVNPQLETRSKSFSDGLGRHIQSSAEKDDGSAVRTITLYNERGLTDEVYESFEGSISPVVRLLGGSWFGDLVGIKDSDPLSFEGIGSSFRDSRVDVDAGYSKLFYFEDPSSRVKKTFPLSEFNPDFHSQDSDCTEEGVVCSMVDYENIDETVDYSFVTSIDALGNEVVSKYDKLGNLVSVKGFNDGEEIITTYEYNGLGNLLSRITDAEGRVVVDNIDYNTLGQVESTWSLDSGTTKFTYDDNGNVLTVTDSNGVVLTKVYDDLDRVIELQYSCSEDGGYDQVYCNSLVDNTEPLFYTYDSTCVDGGLSGIGHLCKVELGYNGPSVSYTYDIRGNVLRTKEVIAGKQYLTNYDYDDAGNVKSVKTLTDGVETSYSYDSLNRLKDVSIDGEIIDYNYGSSNTGGDKVGMVKQIDFPSGSSTDYIYHSRGWVSELETSINYNDNWVPGLREVYTYDDVGNLNELSTGTNLVEFIYDDFYRLESIDNLGYYDYTSEDVDFLLNSIGYDYDNVGNRESRDVTGSGEDFNDIIWDVSSYSYGQDNRLDSDGLCEYYYDEVGSLISKECDGEITSYEYLANSMLKSVVGPGVNLEFVYNPLGNRIRKIDNLDSSNSLIYSYGLGSSPLLTLDRSSILLPDEPIRGIEGTGNENWGDSR